MSLKSGLLAESTWAMDALNILLFDDTTIAYFHLKHLPGLLNILLEHFLKCLKLIFKHKNEFSDIYLTTDDYYNNQSIEDKPDLFDDSSSTSSSSSDSSLSSLSSEEDEDDDDDDDDTNGHNSDTTEPKSKLHNGISNHKKRSFKTHNKKYDSSDPNEDDHDLYLNLNKNKILKVNLNDNNTRNRFMHYYKSCKYNDSRLYCEQWYKYNKKVLRKLNKKLQKKSSNDHKTEKIEQDQDELIEKQQLKINKKKPRKKNINELNKFIQTNFTMKNDVINLSKLFYASENSFYKDRLKLNRKLKNELNEQKLNENNSKISSCLFKRKKLSNNNIGNRNLNDEFVKRHQGFSANSTNGNKRRIIYDDQSVTDEENLFKIVNQCNLELINRCICLSTIIRNLSFVPGNDVELCKYPVLLKILARLLVLKHTHKINLINKNKTDNTDDGDEIDDSYLDDEFECINKLRKENLFYKIDDNLKSVVSSSDSEDSDKDEDADDDVEASEDDDEQDKNEWWWDCVHLLRENTLVTIANISGALNLNKLDEDVIKLYSHGLVHWSICKSNDAQDTMSTLTDTSVLSPQRLSIESLSKMTVNDINIDLILLTISNVRPHLDMLINVLCSEWLVKRDDETLREFSIVLLTAMAKCDQYAAHRISRYATFFISFIEDFEELCRRNNLLVPNFHQIQLQLQQQSNSNFNSQLQLMDTSNINEENLGTTVDMLRRCSSCLMYLSMYSENIPFIMKHENRILDLITSQFVDFKCAQILSEVLYYCSSFSGGASTTTNLH